MRLVRGEVAGQLICQNQSMPFQFKTPTINSFIIFKFFLSNHHEVDSYRLAKSFAYQKQSIQSFNLLEIKHLITQSIYQHQNQYVDLIIITIFSQVKAWPSDFIFFRLPFGFLNESRYCCQIQLNKKHPMVICHSLISCVSPPTFCSFILIFSIGSLILQVIPSPLKFKFAKSNHVFAQLGVRLSGV